MIRHRPLRPPHRAVHARPPSRPRDRRVRCARRPGRSARPRPTGHRPPVEPPVGRPVRRARPRSDRRRPTTPSAAPSAPVGDRRALRLPGYRPAPARNPDAHARRPTPAGHDDRPRLLHPRQLHGQRGPRPGAARGPRRPRPSRRPRCTRCSTGPNDAEIAARPRCTPRSPTARACSTCRSRTASRRWTCRRSSSAAAAASRAGPAARPGRVHAHPVPDRRRASGSRSTAAVTSQRRGLIRSDYPVGRGTSTAAAIFVDRPAWGAASATPGAVSGLANVFEAHVPGRSCCDADGRRSSSTSRSWPSCGTGCWGTFKASSATPCRRPSTGRSGCTTCRPRTARPRTSPSTGSGSRRAG